MRPVTLLSFLFVVSGIAANAQFTLQPQMGIENPLTKMTYDNGAYYVPLQSQLAPRLGLRMDYKFKQGHGVFLGIAGSRSAVEYSFASPENGMTNYTASVGNMQLRFEGGYQFNTKPIFFKKQAVAKHSAPTKVATTEKRGCGGYSYSSHCGGSNRVASQPKVNQSWFVKIQPSIGMAFVPAGGSSLESGVKNGQPVYTYSAGEYSTALITGAGFEFGAANKRLFTLNINYFKGLSDQSEKLVTQTAGKDVITSLNSKVSGWNATIGIPISLGKSKQQVAAKHTEVKKSNCEYYRSRCGRRI
jgi:hypothetical protein